MKNEEIEAIETTYTVATPQNKAGLRLDKYLAGELETLSRTRIKALLVDGRVCVDGHVVQDPARKIRAGEIYTVSIPPVVAAKPEPQDIPLAILYEDDDVIVIDKPPGMVVHPGAGNPDGTLVNALLAHCKGSLSGIGGVARPGIVHRLDNWTGGVMIAAKNDAAHKFLSRQFADHSMDRAYYALVWGVPKPLHGEVEGNIGRSPQNRKKMAIVERGGKYALTRYKVVEAFGTVASLVECRLATGRTHQIRVHMTSIAHPLIGDPVYGSAGRRKLATLNTEVRGIIEMLNHQALYAFALGFMHPLSGERMLFTRDKPQYINELVVALRALVGT